MYYYGENGFSTVNLNLLYTDHIIILLMLLELDQCVAQLSPLCSVKVGSRFDFFVERPGLKILSVCSQLASETVQAFWQN